MTPLTLDIPPESRARLSEEAERRNVTESADLAKDPRYLEEG